jgi:hypothetical protein
MPWTVTRQHQWPDGEFCVEISSGGIDYCNPGMLKAKYAGEGETYDSPLEAVNVAIRIAKEWQAEENEEDDEDDGPRTVHIGKGATGGMTMPFDCEPLDEKTFDNLISEAMEEEAAMPKCDHCGKILPERAYKAYNGCGLDEERYCSEYCADEAIAFYHEQEEDMKREDHEERLRLGREEGIWEE